MELVTVITPCYNAENYIGGAIESVLSQSYKDWEMLVIDDSSSDHSASVIQTYCQKDSRIKYFKTDQKTGSPSIPRNIGFENAQGKYIAFLDSDDVWLPNKLEDQLNFMKENHYPLVYSNYEKINLAGERNHRIVKTKTKCSYNDLLKSCEIPCLTAIFERKLLGDIRFQPIKKEDYLFWIELLRQGIVAHNTNQTHALYRSAPYSRSSNKKEMVIAQWNILYKRAKTPLLHSIYCIVYYAVKGFYKSII